MTVTSSSDVIVIWSDRQFSKWRADGRSQYCIYIALVSKCVIHNFMDDFHGGFIDYRSSYILGYKLARRWGDALWVVSAAEYCCSRAKMVWKTVYIFQYSVVVSQVCQPIFSYASSILLKKGRPSHMWLESSSSASYFSVFIVYEF